MSRKSPEKATRKLSVEEILSGVSCAPTEAMRVLRCRYADVVELMETGKVTTFVVGKRTRIGVESLKRLANGEAEPQT